MLKEIYTDLLVANFFPQLNALRNDSFSFFEWLIFTAVTYATLQCWLLKVDSNTFTRVSGDWDRNKTYLCCMWSMILLMSLRTITTSCLMGVLTLRYSVSAIMAQILALWMCIAEKWQFFFFRMTHSLQPCLLLRYSVDCLDFVSNNFTRVSGDWVRNKTYLCCVWSMILLMSLLFDMVFLRKVTTAYYRGV